MFAFPTWRLRATNEQGRFKVRDPRLFDPCSMRRRPDSLVEPKTPATTSSTPGIKNGNGGSGSTTTHGADTRGAASSTGVTLLLGRLVDHSGGSAVRQEQQADAAKGEQVKHRVNYKPTVTAVQGM